MDIVEKDLQAGLFSRQERLDPRQALGGYQSGQSIFHLSSVA
jgi:hypothetical protein